MVELCPTAWGEQYAAIYGAHKPRLVRWLTAIFGPLDAEDIAQEAMIRLYGRPSLLRDLSDPWPWLTTVARNVGRDLARRNNKCIAVDPRTLTDLADVEVHDPMIARDEALHLLAALARIGPLEREAILLRDVREWAVADVAATFGVNTNAMKQRLFRARRQLAGAYVALDGEPEFDGRRRRTVSGASGADKPAGTGSADCLCGRASCDASARVEAS